MYFNILNKPNTMNLFVQLTTQVIGRLSVIRRDIKFYHEY